MTVMLYKYPGPHDIHGDKFDYVIVEESEAEIKVKEGWSYTTDEAKLGKVEQVIEPELKVELNVITDDNLETAKPTRDELLIKAKELNLDFKPKVRTATLEKIVEEAMKNELDEETVC